LGLDWCIIGVSLAYCRCFIGVTYAYYKGFIGASLT